MTISKIKATFSCHKEKLWNIVTSLDHYSWRSDICFIQVIHEKQFIEYTKDGVATTFYITCFDTYQRYAIDMENQNIKGHWIGIFKSKDQLTEVEFIEEVTAKKIYLKPFIKGYLKKQQKQYIADLKRKLGEL